MRALISILLNAAFLTRLALLAIITVSAALPACKADKDEDEAYVVHTPLALDPMDEIDTPQWWSSETRLLELRGDETYRIYTGLDRYSEPVEQGRWIKRSYAHYALEPYRPLGSASRRATLMRSVQGLVLELPRGEQFHALSNPPESAVDRLTGIWHAPQGILELEQTMAYTFEYSLAARRENPDRLNHRGRWRMENNTVLLTPASQRTKPIELTIEEVEGETWLSSSDPDLHLRRETDESRAVSAEPAGSAEGAPRGG